MPQRPLSAPLATPLPLIAALLCALVLTPAAPADADDDSSRGDMYASLLEKNEYIYVSDELAGTVDRGMTVLNLREAAAELDADNTVILVVPGWRDQTAIDMPSVLHSRLRIDGLYLVVPVVTGPVGGAYYEDGVAVNDGPVRGRAITYARNLARPGDRPEDIVRALADVSDMEDEELRAAADRARLDDQAHRKAIEMGRPWEFLFLLDPTRERVGVLDRSLVPGVASSVAVVLALTGALVFRRIYRRRGWAR